MTRFEKMDQFCQHSAPDLLTKHLLKHLRKQNSIYSNCMYTKLFLADV